MSQALLLVNALKYTLRSQNLTYKDIAKHLKLSEASIKRMFAQSQLTLERIDAICELLGMEISDLLQKMQELTKRITQLTLEQEKTIVSDHKLCLITICVVNHWSLNDILQYYNLSEHECIRYLAKLDKIKIIELLPKNKIKLLISPNFFWIPNGPIQQFFQQYILNDLMRSNFHNENEEMICQFAMLTPESNAAFRKKLRHLAEEFLLLKEEDLKIPVSQKIGNACFLMIRPWAPDIFNPYIKNVGTKSNVSIPQTSICGQF